jgi:hypothetical protein
MNCTPNQIHSGDKVKEEISGHVVRMGGKRGI